MDEPTIADVDCERALLASVWLAGDFVMVLQLEREDFVDPFCGWLWQHLRAMVDANEPLDMVAFLRRLKRPGAIEGLPAEYDEARAKADVAELLGSFGPVSAIDYYFRVLRGERLGRAVLRLCDRAVKRITVERHEPSAVLGWMGEQIDRLLTKVPAAKAPEEVPA